MSQIQDIYSEYTRMRENGLDAKGALSALRIHIEALLKPQRDELATLLRAWEARAVSPPPPPPAPPPKPSPIKPITKPVSVQPITAPPQSVVRATQQVEAVVEWVACPTCGKPNQKHEVFCYACGALLDGGKGSNDTRHFDSPDTATLDSEYFGPDSVLALRVRGSTDAYEARPQQSTHEMIIGRSTSGSAMMPDIDLDKKGAADLGVSRLHLSVRYDPEHQSVLVSDLGSANGSFINGQRMLAKEVRVLRHGDELRLGKLVMIVSFRHPGKAAGN